MFKFHNFTSQRLNKVSSYFLLYLILNVFFFILKVRPHYS
jgi:hypothetical protein